MLRWPFTRPRRVEPQTAYALWAERYPARAHNPLMVLEQQTVLALVPEVASLIVLDAGCGSGRYLAALQQRGARTIGIDLSAAMVERAREVTAKLARADLQRLPVKTMSVDLIVCGLALGDVPQLETAIGEMARALRPGGTLIYSVVHPIGGGKGWLRSFESGGRTLAVDGFWHTEAQHRSACAAAGLRITAWEEPRLAEAPADPAVLVVRATR